VPFDFRGLGLSPAQLDPPEFVEFFPPSRICLLIKPNCNVNYYTTQNLIVMLITTRPSPNKILPSDLQVTSKMFNISHACHAVSHLSLRAVTIHVIILATLGSSLSSLLLFYLSNFQIIYTLIDNLHVSCCVLYSVISVFPPL
jgi:hypothetical protein